MQDSDVLPHPEPAFRGEIARTARDSKADQPVLGRERGQALPFAPPRDGVELDGSLVRAKEAKGKA